MSLVINSYQSGRPSKVVVATVIAHLPIFTNMALTSSAKCSTVNKPIVCHGGMTSEQHDWGSEQIWLGPMRRRFGSGGWPCVLAVVGDSAPAIGPWWTVARDGSATLTFHEKPCGNARNRARAVSESSGSTVAEPPEGRASPWTGRQAEHGGRDAADGIGTARSLRHL